MNSKKNKIARNLKIINQIEKTRSTNNINWMAILKLAIKYAPDESIKIIKKININDQKISKLLKKIS